MNHTCDLSVIVDWMLRPELENDGGLGVGSQHTRDSLKLENTLVAVYHKLLNKINQKKMYSE